MKLVEKLVYAGVVVLIVGTLWILGTTATMKKPSAPAPLVEAPTWDLTEMSGDRLQSADLAGHVYVADFIFTSCKAQCHNMSERMRTLQAELPNRADLKLVSITVDPERDTPERLREYAARYQAEAGRWLFLTGGKEAIEALSTQGFKLPLLEVKEEQGESEAIDFTHSPKLILVDQAGQVRGYYHFEDAAALAQLKRDVAALLR